MDKRRTLTEEELESIDRLVYELIPVTEAEKYKFCAAKKRAKASSRNALRANLIKQFLNGESIFEQN